MKKTVKLSQLIMNKEDPYYRDEKRIQEDKDKKIKEVRNGNMIRHLTWIEQAKDIQSIMTPDGRELTPEELFDFVIGSNITDLAKIEKTDENVADIAIVLGNIGMPTTRERAIKAFELYKLGIVKKIIFTGGISRERDKKGFMHDETIESYKNNELEEGLEWEDLTEADWGAETLVEEEFDENYQKQVTKLTKEYLNKVGINPEDILTEAMSTTTQENAEFCKNIFDSEEIETGNKIKTAILVTTCTHGNRAIRQFKKVFGNAIELKWCPSTLDLEQYDSLKLILKESPYNEIAFRKELKKIYCSDPELTQRLREEVGHNRNVFIRGEIDEPVVTIDDEKMLEHLEGR
ncbi:MAG: YdcF family protein [Clostridia bacterium]|nr:YdcF family protein [Clostridia bacterium]